MGTTTAAKRPTSGKAIAAFVLGILGIVVLPVILSIAAIIYAGKAEDDIGYPPQKDGLALAKAGRVMGWVGLILGAVVVTVCIALASLGY